jgi:hypothetical protein
MKTHADFAVVSTEKGKVQEGERLLRILGGRGAGEGTAPPPAG